MPAGQRRRGRGLGRVQHDPGRGRHQLGVGVAPGDGIRGAAGGEPAGQVRLDGDRLRRGPRPDVPGHVPRQQRHRGGGGAGGDVLGQLGPHAGLGDHPGAGEQQLDLPAQVGLVPCRTGRGQPGQHLSRRLVPLDPPHRQGNELDRPGGGLVAEPGQLVDPPLVRDLGRLQVSLARPVLGPGAGVPRPAQPRPRLAGGVARPPVSLVAVDLAGDLLGAFAERLDEPGQLNHLAGLRLEGEPMRRQRLPEGGVGHHRGVPDALHGADRVPHRHRVDPAPPPRGEHPRVDLQMDVPVRIPGPAGEMLHRHRLDPLDRRRHLPTTRPDPGRGVPTHPGHDLDRRPVLRRRVRPRDVRMQLRGDRPRLRPVDDHLREPQRMLIVPDPPARLTGARVNPGHPRLVGVTIQLRHRLDLPVPAHAVPLREAGPLSQVVVIRPPPLRLHIVPGSTSRTPIELHPTPHPPPLPPPTTQ